MSRRYRYADMWEDELFNSVVGVALLVMLVVAGIILTLLYLTVTELFRIYRARATDASQTSRHLWTALACLLGVFLLAGLYAGLTQDGVTSLIIVSWSFLVYVLACEYIDWQARRNEPPLKELTLADVAAWQPPPHTTASSNGARPQEVEHI